jgi:hypothetical protein
MSVAKRVAEEMVILKKINKKKILKIYTKKKKKSI